MFLALLLCADLEKLLETLARGGGISQMGGGNRAHPVGRFLRFARDLRNGQFRGFFPAVQLERVARSEEPLMLGNRFMVRARHTSQLFHQLSSLGFLSALQIGIIQKVERVELVMWRGAVLLRSFGSGCGSGDVGRYGFLP